MLISDSQGFVMLGKVWSCETHRGQTAVWTGANYQLFLHISLLDWGNHLLIYVYQGVWFKYNWEV